jgi:hypothetical protein
MALNWASTAAVGRSVADNLIVIWIAPYLIFQRDCVSGLTVGCRQGR